MEATTVMMTFGGILFLIAVIGGGFAVKEISVPPVPRWARVVSGVSGTILLVIPIAELMEDEGGNGGGGATTHTETETDTETDDPLTSPPAVSVAVTDDTEQLRLNVPEAWGHVLSNGWHASMDPYDGSSPIGPGVNASTNADDWRAGRGALGVFVGASHDAVEHYDPERLANVWSHQGCEIHGHHAAATTGMTGHQAVWRCPETTTRWYDIALWPDQRDFIVLVQIHVRDRDTRIVDDILDSLQVLGAEPPS